MFFLTWVAAAVTFLFFFELWQFVWNGVNIYTEDNRIWTWQLCIVYFTVRTYGSDKFLSYSWKAFVCCQTFHSWWSNLVHPIFRYLYDLFVIYCQEIVILQICIYILTMKWLCKISAARGTIAELINLLGGSVTPTSLTELHASQTSQPTLRMKQMSTNDAAMGSRYFRISKTRMEKMQLDLKSSGIFSHLFTCVQLSCWHHLCTCGNALQWRVA